MWELVALSIFYTITTLLLSGAVTNTLHAPDIMALCLRKEAHFHGPQRSVSVVET